MLIGSSQHLMHLIDSVIALRRHAESACETLTA